MEQSSLETRIKTILKDGLKGFQWPTRGEQLILDEYKARIKTKRKDGV